jgi:quinol monooxygenase YgiN
VVQLSPGRSPIVGVRWHAPSVLLVCRFVAAPADTPALLSRARRALQLLTAADGCLGGELGRSVDEPEHWVLAVRFASVDAYRRALSPFAVREHVIPLLSEAQTDTPSTYETLATAKNGETEDHKSLLA